jgi:hypothetical protein
MIKIIHRINSVKKLKKIDNNHGIEIDVRSFNKNLILNHDPFKNGDLLKNWVKFYNHKLLIVNIKEEGLEYQILKILNKYKIKNYFFLDQTFPFLVKFSHRMKKNCAFRLSDYESISTIKKIKDKIKWVWIDFFENFYFDKKDFEFLKKNELKICLVSPELKNLSSKKIKIMKNIIKKNNIKVDAICTKKPNLW